MSLRPLRTEETGSLIWSFTRNDFTKSAWDTSLASLPTGSEGRPEGNNSRFDIGNGSYIRHQLGYEQPTYGQSSVSPVYNDGELIFQGYNPAQDEHNQITIESDSEYVDDHYLFGSPNRYRIYFQVDIKWGAVSWLGNVWTIVYDMLPANNPTGWIGSSEPPIGLYMRPDDNLWRLVVRGADQGTVDWDHETTVGELPLNLGSNNNNERLITMEFELDYTGANSYTAVWIDDDLLGETLLSNCKFSNTNSGQMVPKFGNYTFTPSGGEISTTGLYIYEVSEEEGEVQTLVTSYSKALPSEIIQQLLIDKGIGQDPTADINPDLSTTDPEWRVYSTNMPDTPDINIVVMDTEGYDTGRYMQSGAYNDFPGIQIQVRDSNLKRGWEKISEINRYLTEHRYGLDLPFTIKVLEEWYQIHNISKTSGPLSLGYEQGDTTGLISRRFIFTSNYVLRHRWLENYE